MSDETHTCGVCGWEIDPELEEYHAITNRLTGETYDYVCDNHDTTDVLGEMMVIDGRLA